MAKWRDKQSQDYRIPSDIDKLDEIRRQHMQQNEWAGERTSGKISHDTDKRAPIRASSHFLYLIVIVAFLAQTGLVILILQGQQSFHDRISNLDAKIVKTEIARPLTPSQLKVSLEEVIAKSSINTTMDKVNSEIGKITSILTSIQESLKHDSPTTSSSRLGKHGEVQDGEQNVQRVNQPVGHPQSKSVSPR